MRIIILSIVLLFCAFSAKSQVLKSAGVWYFLDVDSMTARPAVLPNGTELAYVVGTKTVYYWNRNTSTWTAYGSTFGRDSIYFDASIVGSGTISDPWGVDSTLFATIAGVGDSIANALLGYLPIEGGTLTGTGGAGFIGFPSQGVAPGTPASGLNVYSQGSSFNWKGTDGHERQITSSLTGGRNYALPDVNGTFALGTGTADRSARWSATNTLAAGNFTDNGTKLQALLPFQLHQWTTAGRPSGVTGYEGYNTTGNGKEWYQGSRWAYALESTFARGTATRVPFFDANGQVTDNSGMTFSASSGFTIASTGSDVFSGTSTNASSTAMIIQNTSSGTKKWAFALAGSGNAAPHGSFVFYNYESNLSLWGLYAVSRKVILNQDAGITWATGSSISLSGDDVGISRATGGVLRMNNGTSLSTASTSAFGLAYGTTAQTPTEFNGQIRMNSDTSTVQIYTGGARAYLATRAYARSLVASATWLKPQLEAGSVTINAATNADLLINNLDSVKFGKTLIRSSNNGLLILNPDVGASGIATFGAGYHTVINGVLNGSDGGTGQIILGGTITANTSGSIFGISIGYGSNITTSAYGIGLGHNADVTADNGAAFGRNALADEANEMSIGSDIYTKLNLWAGGTNGSINAVYYGTGAKEAADLSKIQSAYIAGFATDGTLLDYPISGLGNGIYSGSGTLASHTTRALVPSTGNLYFSQLYNSSADSAFFYFQNAGGGERYVGLGLTDTASTGGASLILGNAGAGDLSFELKATDAVSGTTRVRGLDGDLLLSASDGNISLTTDVASEVQVIGLVRAKQEAYYEITSTSSPQTFSNTYSDNFVNQGGTQASFTFLFPASPEDGQILSMTWNNAISALTLDGNGNTITGTAVTTAVAGTRRQFKYYASAATWIKIY